MGFALVVMTHGYTKQTRCQLLTVSFPSQSHGQPCFGLCISLYWRKKKEEERKEENDFFECLFLDFHKADLKSEDKLYSGGSGLSVDNYFVDSSLWFDVLSPKVKTFQPLPRSLIIMLVQSQKCGNNGTLSQHIFHVYFSSPS